VDLTNYVDGLVKDALERCKFPFDEVDHTVSLTFVPAQGNLIPGWAVLMIVKSPLLGQNLTQLNINVSAKPTTEEIDELVMAGMENLRTIRAQMMNGTGELQ
jgi:hypothetical protein